MYCPFHCISDVNVYLVIDRKRGGGEESPIERMNLRPYLIVSALSADVLKVKNILLKMIYCAKCVISIRDLSLPPST